MKYVRKKITDSFIHVFEVEGGEMKELETILVEGSRVSYIEANRIAITRYGTKVFVKDVQYQDNVYRMPVRDFIEASERVVKEC